MKYSRKQRLQYLSMLGKVGEDWQNAVGGLHKYKNSAGWRLLTTLWRFEKMKMTETYQSFEGLMSPNTQRQFVLDAIGDGLVDCDDRALVESERLKKRGGTSQPGKNDRRGLSSPYVWLSEETRREVDIFFDKAIDQVLRTAEEVRAEAG